MVTGVAFLAYGRAYNAALWLVVGMVAVVRGKQLTRAPLRVRAA